MFLTDRLFSKEALSTSVVCQPSHIDFDEIEVPRSMTDVTTDDINEEDDDDWDDDDDDD